MKPFLSYLLAIIFGVAVVGAIHAQNNASADLPTSIDNFVQQHMAAGKLPGLSLVIVRDGKVHYSKGYGLANLEHQTPMTDRTRVAIGSTTKGMTALAVMQLVEQGKLDLDAPVVKYLPWFKVNDARGSIITLRHLLSHSSGLPAGTPFDGNRDPKALERHVRSLATTKLNRAPGLGYEYANDGYAVAGLVVQAVSGMPYADYMTQFVFAPLGMEDSTFDLTRAEHEGLAQGYVKQRGGFVPRPMTISQGIAPAGTLLTSARDVGRYLAALQNGRQGVVSAGSLEEMWKPQITIRTTLKYGFGWNVANFNGLEVVFHTGSVVTSGSALVMVPSQRLAVGVLANFSDGHAEEIAQGLTTLLLGGRPQPPSQLAERGPSTFKPNPQAWQKYVGDYQTELGVVRLYIEGNRLLGNSGGLALELEAYGDNDFVVRGEVGLLEGHTVSFKALAKGGMALMLDGNQFGYKE